MNLSLNQGLKLMVKVIDKNFLVRVVIKLNSYRTNYKYLI